MDTESFQFATAPQSATRRLYRASLLLSGVVSEMQCRYLCLY